MRTFLGILSLTFVLGVTASRAGADTLWSKAGAGCVVGDPGIQGNRYTIVAGSVGNNGSNVAVVTLYCPVETLMGDNATSLSLTYNDSTNTDPTNHVNNVRAQLVRMAHSDGSIGNISGASLNSDSGSTGSHQISVTFTHTFDFDLYNYYVRIDFDRDTTSDTATFYGVALSN